MHPTQPPLNTHTLNNHIDSSTYPNQSIETVIIRPNPINQSNLITNKEADLRQRTVRYDSSSRIIYDKRHNQNSRVIQHYEPIRVQQKSPIHKPLQKQVRQSQQTATLLSNETVPKIQYERCVSECKNWETKYNELYLKYMNLQTMKGQGEVEELRQENWKLCQVIKEYEEKERRMRETMEETFELFVRKYEESTVQECMLLVDRFRLQSQSK